MRRFRQGTHLEALAERVAGDALVVACDEIGVRKNNRTTDTDYPYIMARL
jgi:hypothetical protein